MSLTPRQRETYEAVEAYRKAHGGGIAKACKALGLAPSTYDNARLRLIHGRSARWKGGTLVPRPAASDREAFEFDEEELPF